MPHVAGSAYGDLLYWTGSIWNTIATSSLGISGGTNYTNSDANAYIHASTTIPKTYTANTFSALQIFGNASTTQLSVSNTAYFPGSGIWNSSGNLGVGTTSPYSKLSVTGDTAFNGNLLVTGTTTANGFVLNTGKTFYIGTDVLVDSSGNINATVLPLQDTASNLASVVPLSGERVYETDTKLTKIGDGLTGVGNLSALNNHWIKNVSELSYNSGGIKISSSTIYSHVGGITYSPLWVASNKNTDIDNFTLLTFGNHLNTNGVPFGLQYDPLVGLYVDDGAGGYGRITSNCFWVDTKCVNSYNTWEFDENTQALSSPNLVTRIGIASTSPWKTLSVVGTVAINGLTGSTGAGSICLSANKELVYNSGSDACLPSLHDTKHDITKLSLDALSIVNDLEPVSFIYNDGDQKIRYGFIAEDTKEVNGQLVTYNADGALSGIDDRAMVSLLVKAIKELGAKLDAVITNILASLKNLVSDTVTVKDTLCVGQTCVNEVQLKALLNNANVTPLAQPIVVVPSEISTSTQATSIEATSTAATSTLETTATLTPEITSSTVEILPSETGTSTVPTEDPVI